MWWNAKKEAIAKITALFTALVVSVGIMENAATDWTPKIKEEHITTDPTATPSAYDWTRFINTEMQHA